MRVTVLAGGIGGARFLRGVRAAGLGEIVAIVNTGDDITLHGLRVCPDLDSVMYTLGEAHDGARGWGRRGESWRVGEELAAYGIGPGWFGLGDLDLATHLVRTELLGAGYPLSEVTAALGQRWPLGARLLPMTDQRCETHVIVPAAASESEGRNSPRGPGAPAAPSLFDASGDRAASSAPVPPRDPAALADPDARAARRAIHFQEWWVRHRAALPASAFVQVGVADAKPAPGVLEAIATADLVLLAPSNPVVSIGTILGVPGIR
ncbi:MAG: 2-phospho-L-lactate transferase CofD family protein, partial [Actinomycetia bacterium]|nr:2-phospho-L-lactate transferase CofD family protein [Actinomycetes bacterium]